jgi:hypothetical protein
MSRSRLPIVTLLLAVLVVLLRPVPAPAQIAFVSIKSTDEMLADFRYLAPVFGQSAAVKQLDAVIGADNKGLTGIDRRRPLGLYVLWPEKITKLDELNFPVVGFVPITDEKAFFKLLPQFGAEVKKGEGDTHEVTIPDGTKFTLRVANNHAYVSLDAKALAGKLPEPSTFLPKTAQKSIVVATIRLDQFPKDYKQLIEEIVTPLQDQFAPFADVGKKKPGETEEQYAERLAAARQVKQIPDMLRASMTGLVTQGKEITLAVDVDRKEHRAGVSLTLTPRPDTDMAKAFRFLGGGRSRFGPLLDKADGGLLIHIPTSVDNKTPPDPDAIASLMRNSLPFTGAVRDALTKLIGVVGSTIAVDGLDVGVLVTLRPKDEVAILAGLKVQNGKKLDQALRDLYKSLPADEKKDFAVDWNQDKHGTARIHRAKVANDPDDLYLAIRDDVAIFAFGKQSVEPLKTTLDAFGKDAPAASPIVRARVSSRAILADEAFRKIAEKELSTTERNEMFGELTLEGGNELKLRLRTTTPLLRALAIYGKSDK